MNSDNSHTGKSVSCDWPFDQILKLNQTQSSVLDMLLRTMRIMRPDLQALVWAPSVVFIFNNLAR